MISVGAWAGMMIDLGFLSSSCLNALPNSIVPVCPCTSRGGGRGGKGSKEHVCEGFHCKHPSFRAHKRPHSTKRARLDPDEPILEGDSDDED